MRIAFINANTRSLSMSSIFGFLCSFFLLVGVLKFLEAGIFADVSLVIGLSGGAVKSDGLNFALLISQFWSLTIALKRGRDALANIFLKSPFFFNSRPNFFLSLSIGGSVFNFGHHLLIESG